VTAPKSLVSGESAHHTCIFDTIPRRRPAVRKKVQTVVIETPEHLDLEFRLAGLGTRFLAYLIDRLIQFGFIITLIILTSLSLHLTAKLVPLGAVFGKIQQSAAHWIVAAAVLVYGVITIGYFILFEYLWNGATPGKRWQGIRVISKDGTPITFVDSAVRNILRFVDVLAEVYPIGLVVMFVDSKNRRLGDLAAGTLVILESSAQIPQYRSEEPRDQPEIAPAIKLAVSRMTPDDFRVVSKYLARCEGLDAEYRRELAQEIHFRLFEGTGHFLPPGSDPEQDLAEVESVYRQRTRVL